MSAKSDDNLPLAMVLAVLTALFISLMHLFAKLLGDMFTPLEITFLRNCSALAFLLLGFLVFRRMAYVKTQRPYAQIARALCGTLGIFFGMWSVTIMPLADATALMFTQPLWVVVLAHPLLKERVGIYRACAVVVGFSGVLLIVGPSGQLGVFEAVIGLLAGFFSALVALCLRWLGKTESSYTTVFYFLFIGLILTGLPLPFTGSAVLEVHPFSMPFLLVVLLGIVGLASLIVKTLSYRLGPASLVTPVSYIMIIWAGLFDYVFWAKVPGLALLIGGAIVIGSNLFILWREQRAKVTHIS